MQRHRAICSKHRCSVLNLLAEGQYRGSTQISSRTRYWILAYLWGLLQGDGVETEVTWEDQQHINLFGRLNNKFHELEDEIKATKVSMKYLRNPNTCCYLFCSLWFIPVTKEIQSWSLMRLLTFYLMFTFALNHMAEKKTTKILRSAVDMSQMISVEAVIRVALSWKGMRLCV